MYNVALWYSPYNADGFIESWDFDTLDEARTFAKAKAKEYSNEYYLSCTTDWFRLEGTR